MKRLFIAINLPENVKNKIARKIDEIDADFRWVRAENWHLTLVFLGNQPDEAITGILNSIKDVAQKFSNIEIDPHTKRGLAPSAQNNYPRYGVGVEFDKIILAPPGKPARMIWLTGTPETSKTLGQIQKDLENNLINNGVRFQMENRLFNAHLTLTRFESTNLSNLPIIQSPIGFVAESIDLMESTLKRTGAEYDVLSKFAFTK